MSEFVEDVPLVFCITDEETFSVVEFPFELIGSYVAVQDIPRYSFGLERQVRLEMAEFKDEISMRKLHQEHQRRPVKRNNNVQPMPRAQTTPLSTMSSLSDNSSAGGVEPLVRFSLPVQKKPEDTTSRPMTSRLRGLFRSKTRTTPHA